MSQINQFSMTVIYPPASAARREFKLTVEGVDAEHALDNAWRRMNVVTGDADLEIPIREQARSSMIGDIYVINYPPVKEGNTSYPARDEFYIVDNLGFQRISKEVADLWERISYRDRTMGTSWVFQLGMKALLGEK